MEPYFARRNTPTISTWALKRNWSTGVTPSIPTALAVAGNGLPSNIPPTSVTVTVGIATLIVSVMVVLAMLL